MAVKNVESDIMGNWHHPKGRREDGTFLPSMEYGRLLRDERFKDWHDHYRSKAGRSSALTTVYRLMKEGNLASPGRFLELEPLEAKTLIRRVVHRLEDEEHYQGARMALSFAKNFYNYHNIDLGREIKFKRSELPKRRLKKIHFEVIPDNPDVYKMADAALGLGYKDNVKNKFLGLRNRAIILCLWQSGVRGSALCRFTFGMVKKHLYPTVKVPIPLRITDRIDTKISQYGLGYYYTFLAEEAAKALRAWLDARIEAEAPKDKAPLFTVFDMDRNTISDKPMRRGMVLNAVKTAAGRAGLNPDGIWSHCLRKSFRKVLNRNYHMDEDTKEALMGHKLPGSRGNYFDYHDIKEIAEKYMKCDFTPGAEFALDSLERKLIVQEEKIQALSNQLEKKPRAPVFTEDQAWNMKRLDQLLLKLGEGPKDKPLIEWQLEMIEALMRLTKETILRRAQK